MSRISPLLFGTRWSSLLLSTSWHKRSLLECSGSPSQSSIRPPVLVQHLGGSSSVGFILDLTVLVEFILLPGKSSILGERDRNCGYHRYWHLCAGEHQYYYCIDKVARAGRKD